MKLINKRIKDKHHFPRYAFMGCALGKTGANYYPLYDFVVSPKELLSLGERLPYPHCKIVDKSILAKYGVIATGRMDLNKRRWWNSLSKLDKQVYRYAKSASRE